MGDGVLLLWDTRKISKADFGNIVVSLGNICAKYATNFAPRIKKKVSKAPRRLRCGIARGQIISIGNGSDFVGPCINMAARLQKVEHFSFACSKRGFSLDHFSDGVAKDLVLVKTAIRGVGSEELFYVMKKEFSVLEKAQKQEMFVDQLDVKDEP